MRLKHLVMGFLLEIIEIMESGVVIAAMSPMNLRKVSGLVE